MKTYWVIKRGDEYVANFETPGVYTDVRKEAARYETKEAARADRVGRSERVVKVTVKPKSSTFDGRFDSLNADWANIPVGEVSEDIDHEQIARDLKYEMREAIGTLKNIVSDLEDSLEFYS